MHPFCINVWASGASAKDANNTKERQERKSFTTKATKEHEGRSRAEELYRKGAENAKV